MYIYTTDRSIVNHKKYNYRTNCACGRFSELLNPTCSIICVMPVLESTIEYNVQYM
jgi:hypothetical protein